ncbi:MAG: FKBP-type peptidyl-prolyl cis-trans isomerase [Saprospiraceae bacterium]|nr:FKBP-type peptidyl-prolyl cis-trans isomerase [Saprospiraceae bacterium]
MKIENNTVVSLNYELRTNGFESQIVEKTDDDHPLEFIYGVGMMIPKFEEYLEGKSANDKFQFMINAEDGYGLSSDDNLVELPKSIFQVDGKESEELLVLGKILPMQDNTGHMFNGTVAEIKNDSVIMDFNHPMADQDLYFTGVINSVRKATQEELEHGHVHSPGHHHH